MCFFKFVDAKRLIGRTFSDASVQSDVKLWPFKVVSGPGDKPMIVLQYKGEEKQFAAKEISSMVLTVSGLYEAGSVRCTQITKPLFAGCHVV